MTEKEAWQRAASQYENNLTPMRFGTHITGLCIWIANTSRVPKVKMKRRLALFQPGINRVWYWANSNGKIVRERRATACGFLAAMCEEGKNDLQERHAEGPPVGEPPREISEMTDRVLSEEEVTEIDEIARGVIGGWNFPEDALRLIVSHRILAEMVKQYERKDYGE